MSDTQTASDASICVQNGDIIHLQSLHGADVDAGSTGIALVFVDYGNKRRWNHRLGLEIVEPHEQRAAIGTAVADEAFDIDGVDQPVFIGSAQQVEGLIQ